MFDGQVGVYSGVWVGVGVGVGVVYWDVWVGGGGVVKGTWGLQAAVLAVAGWQLVLNGEASLCSTGNSMSVTCFMTVDTLSVMGGVIGVDEALGSLLGRFFGICSSSLLSSTSFSKSF